MHDGIQIGLIFGASVLLSAFVTSPPEAIAKIIGVTLAVFIVALFVAPVIMVFQKYRKGKEQSDRTVESNVETSTIEEITDEVDNTNCDDQPDKTAERSLINDLGADRGAAAERGEIETENDSPDESKTLD